MPAAEKHDSLPTGAHCKRVPENDVGQNMWVR